jgi:Na+/H+-dicarboxylate symporter
MKIIDIIMLFSPYGVFALMAALMVEIPVFYLRCVRNLWSNCTVRLVYDAFVFYPTLLMILLK